MSEPGAGDGRAAFVFRQLFDPVSFTYTYLLADGSARESVLIDPVFEQAGRDAALLRELGLKLLWTLETHVHADHVTAAALLKSRLGSRIAVAKAAGADGADRYLQDCDTVRFGARHLTVRATPGHTMGCLTYVLDNESMAFTGDSLLIRGCGRTDFQEGDARTLYRSLKSRVLTLPDNCLLYPAHDYRGLTVTSVAEERRFNPRFGGELSEDDFIGFMANLGLPHPGLMDFAVPANLECGRPRREELLAVPDWGPAMLSFSGVLEIQPHWVEEHLRDLTIVDVREQEEYDGPLGHIPGAQLIPLAELAKHAGDLARDKPVITVCRAGGRSAQATVILGKAGFRKVANLAGGMLRWRALRLVVEGSDTLDV